MTRRRSSGAGSRRQYRHLTTLTRVQSSDFHYSTVDKVRADQIRICCTFSDLTRADRGAFVEHLSNPATGGRPALHVNWIAKRQETPGGSRRFNATEWRSGIGGEGPILDPGARALLTATYLRPLRDAERALSAGRGSRLAQILQNTHEITDDGTPFDKAAHKHRQERRWPLLMFAKLSDRPAERGPGAPRRAYSLAGFSSRPRQVSRASSGGRARRAMQ